MKNLIGKTIYYNNDFYEGVGIDSYPLVNVEVLDQIAGEKAEGGFVVCAFGR